MSNETFTELMIEPTNLCNLRCPVCPTGEDYNSQKRGVMTFQQFRKILEPVARNIRNIALFNLGEPFLAPDIIKMIRYIDKHKISTNIHTNGNALNKKMINKFIIHKSNLSINFTIDGVTQKSYEYYRQRGSLKKAMDNMKYFVKIKNRYNLLNIKIVWIFLVMKTNEHEISQATTLAKRIGVDAIRFKTILIDKYHEKYNDFVPQTKRDFAMHKDEKFELVDARCDFIDPGRPVINWNGDVLPCCVINDYILGNAFKDSLLSIWENRKYKEFKEYFIAGSNELCNLYCLGKSKKIMYAEQINFDGNKRR